MKTRTYLLYVIIGILFLTGCKKENDDAVWINFINTTGINITHAKAEDLDLGNITGNGQTGYKRMESFGENANTPVISFYGTFNGKHIESFPLRCPIGTSGLPPGKYDVLVDTVNYDTDDYFILSFK